MKCPICNGKRVIIKCGGSTGLNELNFTIYNYCECYKCETTFVHNTQHLNNMKKLYYSDICIRNKTKANYYQIRQNRKKKLKKLKLM